MTLDELQRIKQWHVAHKADHPLEYHLWDLVLTVWMLGWVGWFPICAFGEPCAAPVCLIGIFSPACTLPGAPARTCATPCGATGSTPRLEAAARPLQERSFWALG